MSKSKTSSTKLRKAKNDELFIRADKLVDSGESRAAFRLFLAGAKAGDRVCQLNVGNCYDDAKGVRRNREAALYWYKRAYRRGDAAAACNLGILWRNEGKHARPLAWLKRAVKMGDDEANLEIANHYLKNEYLPRRAITYLRKAVASSRVSEAGAEEAVAQIRQIQKRRDNFASLSK